MKAVASQRAADKLESLRQEFAWVEEGKTALVREEDGSLQWWTFAGMRANSMLGLALGDHSDGPVQKDNLAMPVRAGTRAEELAARLRDIDVHQLRVPVEDDVLEALKFVECMPRELAVRMISERAADVAAVAHVVREPLRDIQIS